LNRNKKNCFGNNFDEFVTILLKTNRKISENFQQKLKESVGEIKDWHGFTTYYVY
jgi:hypothetical protein